MLRYVILLLGDIIKTCISKDFVFENLVCNYSRIQRRRKKHVMGRIRCLYICIQDNHHQTTTLRKTPQNAHAYSLTIKQT